ncbi:MAG: DoxX family membrane protein, partial [Microlunatus sp.]|nr:DoxX family membrane protein [Microlunatus sp.]
MSRHKRPAMLSTPATPSTPQWIAGPEWTSRGLRQPGWLLLPLRGFLAITFLYAGLQKLADPGFFDPSNPGSVIGQMRSLQHTSPIGPLIGVSLHAPIMIGLLIAVGELAIGAGVLLGLWTRLAALAGMLLSLIFFLTLSWNTNPYFYGSDIVFVFAWSVMAAFGAGDVLSVDAWLRARARRLSGLPVAPALISIDAVQLRRLCGRGQACTLQQSGACLAGAHCPVFPTTEQLPPATEADVSRRALLLGARTAALVGVAAAVTGGMTAIIGRLVGGGSTAIAGGLNSLQPTHPAATTHAPSTPKHRSSHSSTKASGTALVKASAVPVGQGGQFNDPASGNPAWLVR